MNHDKLIKAWGAELSLLGRKNEAELARLREQLVEKYGEGVRTVEDKIKREAEKSHARGEFCSEAGRRAW